MRLPKARASSSGSHLKVTVYWGDILYDTLYCGPRDHVTVGRKIGNTVVVPLEGQAQHMDSLELIKVLDDNSVELRFDDSIQGHVRMGEEFLRLRSAIDEKRVTPEMGGTYLLKINQKDEADLVIGHVTFNLSWTSEHIAIPRASGREKRRNLIMMGVGTLVLMMVAGLVKLFPPPPEEPPPERLVELEPRQPPPPPAKAAAGEKKTEDGGAAKGDAGQAKLQTKPQLTEAEKLRQELSGDLVKDLAEVGTSAPTVAKANPDNAITAAIDQAGTGGFTTEGFKTGAGGKSVGIGRTVGQGEGGFGGTGKLGLSGNSAVEGGSGYGAIETVTEGGLDRDVIDSIVKKRKARIRLCYERQLNFKPSLAGKVTVHFVIGKSGNVLSSSIAEDTMKSAEVNGCIIEEVKTWIFPAPKGGTLVNVDYPFVFESSVKN